MPVKKSSAGDPGIAECSRSMSSGPNARPRLSVSIVMCTFNGARYLSQQLDSIGEQSEMPDELLIVDDCSEDQTPTILKHFASSAKFSVTCIQNHSRLGVTKNFEKALLLSRGEIVLLADQDDIWMPTRVAKTVEAMELSPGCLLVFSNALCIGDDGSALEFTLWDKCGRTSIERLVREPGSQFSVLLKGNRITGATVGIRRKLLDMALPIPETWVHDAWLAAVAASQQAIVGIEDHLVMYRLHASQHIGVGPARLVDRIRFKRAMDRESEVTRFKTLEELLSSKIALSLQREVKSKIKHLELRASLPSSLLHRLVRIALEASSGRYHRFSSGWSSIFLDVTR